MNFTVCIFNSDISNNTLFLISESCSYICSSEEIIVCEMGKVYCDVQHGSQRVGVDS